MLRWVRPRETGRKATPEAGASLLSHISLSGGNATLPELTDGSQATSRVTLHSHRITDLFWLEETDKILGPIVHLALPGHH